MSETCVVVDRQNADGNTLDDIVAAIREIGGTVDAVDEDHHVIEAVVPAHEVMTLSLMDGVAYVRPVCHFMASSEGEQMGEAADEA